MGSIDLVARAEIEIVNAVPEDFELDADREQMFRVLMNLIRNGVEALQKLEQQTFDLMFVDLNMPITTVAASMATLVGPGHDDDS